MPARPAARATATAATEPPPGAGSSEATRSRNSPSGRSKYSWAVFSGVGTRDIPSEQPHRLTVFVYIYALGGGGSAQARHGAHLPADGVDEPGPTDALTSLTGSVQPVGAPLSDGSEVMERCVLAMQMGNSPNPFF